VGGGERGLRRSGRRQFYAGGGGLTEYPRNSDARGVDTRPDTRCTLHFLAFRLALLLNEGSADDRCVMGGGTPAERPVLLALLITRTGVSRGACEPHLSLLQPSPPFCRHSLALVTAACESSTDSIPTNVCFGFQGVSSSKRVPCSCVKRDGGKEHRLLQLGR
jgi:hypothetical protein